MNDRPDGTPDDPRDEIANSFLAGVVDGKVAAMLWERPETILRALRTIQMEGGTTTYAQFATDFFKGSKAKASGRRSAAGAMLGRLRKAGYLDQISRGTYQISEKGRAMLDGRPWPQPGHQQQQTGWPQQPALAPAQRPVGPHPPVWINTPRGMEAWVWTWQMGWIRAWP